MANVLPSLRALATTPAPTATVRRALPRTQEPFQSEMQKAAAPQAAAPKAAETPVPDWRALFSGKAYPASPEPPAQPPNPTAESVFGPNPWMANPTGNGPTGQYAYNPIYFATRETAAKVAQMTGGTVIATSFFTPNGGPFGQNQPNFMVQLENGGIINPGLIASFYTHGYPQSYVEQMVAEVVRTA